MIFNLFGDVKQHVEGSKGIDDWKQVASIANFKKEYMQKNYRNARQITSYCNKRFGINMHAINLDDTGVHECKNRTEFETKVPLVDIEPKINKEPFEDVTRKKRVKRNTKENKADENGIGLKEFFERKGLKVIDDRKKSRHLWVLGSRSEIDFIVTEAMELYGATGSYGSGKVSCFKEGWFTKSKK